jgi:tRNA(Ile2) C34 agmatinyltransferase TiaS
MQAGGVMSATALFEAPVATGITLAQLLTRAHEDVHAHGKADCPVCGGTLLSSGIEAACTSCGSRLG